MEYQQQAERPALRIAIRRGMLSLFPLNPEYTRRVKPGALLQCNGTAATSLTLSHSGGRTMALVDRAICRLRAQAWPMPARTIRLQLCKELQQRISRLESADLPRRGS